MRLVSLPALFAAGGIVGALFPRAPIGLAAASMAYFVARIPIDVLADPTSHNLFPFELLLYALFAALAAGGAALGRRLRRGRPRPA